jgi:hypothetical protein
MRFRNTKKNVPKSFKISGLSFSSRLNILCSTHSEQQKPRIFVAFKLRNYS